MPKKLSYEELRDKWYAKLERTGFDDIENKKGSLKKFSHVNTTKPGQYNQTWRESKEEYYRLCTHFLNEHKFESKLDQVIWEYHTEGLGAPAIADTLNKVKTTKTNRTTIGYIIKDLETKMKAKYGVK